MQISQNRGKKLCDKKMKLFSQIKKYRVRLEFWKNYLKKDKIY